MAAADFARELQASGFQPVESTTPAGHLVRFSYDVPAGTHAGDLVQMAFIVPGDYNLTCPSGPLINPLVLPINTSTSEPPLGGVHDAQSAHPGAELGPDWEYWSRPFPGWDSSTRNARAYMAHIAHLFSLI